MAEPPFDLVEPSPLDKKNRRVGGRTGNNNGKKEGEKREKDAPSEPFLIKYPG